MDHGVFLWDFLLRVLSQISHFSAQGGLGTDVPPREEGSAWDLWGPGGGESVLHSPFRLSRWSFLKDLGSTFLGAALLVGGEVTQTRAALSHALG